MKNGDRLTCEVKQLQAGILKVDVDYVDGTMSIDWSKVARIESSYLFIVTLQDGSRYSASLARPEKPDEDSGQLAIQPASGGEYLLVQGSEVVRITQTSDHFLKRFSGGVNLGATYSKGNRATQYNLGSDLSYLRTRWGASLRVSSTLSSNAGANTSTYNQVDAFANRMLSRKNYFIGGIGTLLQSSVQGVQLQTSLGGGLGRYIKNTNRVLFWALGGVGWQKTGYVASAVNQPPREVAVGVISSELQAFAFKKTRFELRATVFPAITGEKGRVSYKTNASYYVKLFRKIDWNLSFYGNWDTNPPPQFSGSDYGSSTGVSYSFGNK